MLGRFVQGFSAGGRAYGYRSVPVNDETRRDAYGNPSIGGYRKEIDAAEAEVVRPIFHLYYDGITDRRRSGAWGGSDVPGASLRDGAAGPRREPRRASRNQPGPDRESGSCPVLAAGARIPLWFSFQLDSEHLQHDGVLREHKGTGMASLHLEGFEAVVIWGISLEKWT